MTLHPVLPAALLLAVAAAVVAVQAVALRRWRSSGRHRGALWRWVGVTLAALLLLVAATRPVIGAAQTVAAGDAQPNVFVLVDRSPDMAVRDMDDRTRMDVARADIDALIARFPHARFAVIEFASAPTLRWPLSPDTWSLGPVLDSLRPDEAGGDAAALANAGAANTVLRYQLISASAQYPRATNLVFYLGAGAHQSRTPPREFDLPAGAVDGGAVLGYGTAAGGTLPGGERSPVSDAVLRAIAGQLHVPYVPRADSTALTLPGGDAAAGSSSPTSGARTELYWLPAGAAAVLILIELYAVLREIRRRRSVGVREVP
jgi:hypothetical protein